MEGKAQGGKHKKTGSPRALRPGFQPLWPRELGRMTWGNRLTWDRGRTCAAQSLSSNPGCWSLRHASAELFNLDNCEDSKSQDSKSSKPDGLLVSMSASSTSTLVYTHPFTSMAWQLWPTHGRLALVEFCGPSPCILPYPSLTTGKDDPLSLPLVKEAFPLLFENDNIITPCIHLLYQANEYMKCFYQPKHRIILF